MPPAKKAAKWRVAPRDAGEPVALMDPMLPSEGGPRWTELTDLALDLVAKANRLAGRLSPSVKHGVGELVRSMSCYYSNLIEGHDTHPVDIERALKRNFSHDEKKRDLQREAIAHIGVQELIDANRLPGSPDTAAYARAIHKAFCERLPDDLLWVEKASGERVRLIPGGLREHDVTVGGHAAISPAAVGRFLARWEEAYALRRNDRLKRLVAIGAAHHRFLWIHPFLDGNGRVARLLSHAMLARLEVGNPLWSISRGLARNVTRYKGLLAAADERRRGDLDGRGNLSESALAELCAFFLGVAIDQVEYMEKLIEPNELLGRIEAHVAGEIEAGRLPRHSATVLRSVFLAGHLARGRVPEIIGASERTASRVVSALIGRGMLRAESHRSALLPGFPADAAERWLPGLFPAYRG